MEEKMVELIDTLPTLLNQLGEKIGFAGTKIWEWALRDVYVQTTINVILILIIISTSILAAKYIKWTKKKDIDLDYEFMPYGLIMTTLIILLIVAIPIALVIITDLPRLLINPEWCAFQNIIEELNKLK